LAIVRCLDEWRHLLEGAQNKFEIYSNHENLEYFMSSQKLISQMVTYLICDLRKEFFKRVQARFR